MKKIILGLFAISALVVACKKIDSIPVRFTPIPATNTNVKFLNMSPDAPQFNFFVNNIKASATAPTTSGVVQGYVFPAIYPATIGYASVPSGSVTIVAKVTDSSIITPGAVLNTTTENLTANRFYTYAIFDSVSRIQSVLVEDDPSVPDTSKAYFRLGNFIGNGPVRIEFTKTNTAAGPVSRNFPNLTPKTVTNFDSLSAKGATYKVMMYNSANVKLDSISAFTPTATKKYTIYARGVLGLTGTNTRRPIITNYINF